MLSVTYTKVILRIITVIDKRINVLAHTAFDLKLQKISIQTRLK